MTTRYAMTSQHQPTPVGEMVTVLLSILLPPLGVLVRVGWHPHLLISVVLTFLGWLPGVLHAVWVLGRFPYQLRSGR